MCIYIYLLVLFVWTYVRVCVVMPWNTTNPPPSPCSFALELLKSLHACTIAASRCTYVRCTYVRLHLTSAV